MQSLKLVELWPYFKTDFFVSKQYLNPIPYGLFNKPEVMGGADLPPLVIWLSEDILNILF